jgi:hypothetical protein
MGASSNSLFTLLAELNQIRSMSWSVQPMAPSKTRSHLVRLLAVTPAPMGADTQSRRQPPKTAPLDPRIKSLSGPIRHNPPQPSKSLILCRLRHWRGHLRVAQDCPGLSGTVPKVYRIFRRHGALSPERVAR